MLGLAGCNLSTSTQIPPVIVKFPTISAQTETAVFESTLWTPTSTGTITLIPTITDTLEPSRTPRPPTLTATEPTETATLQYSLTPSSTFTATITPHTTKTASSTPTYAVITSTPISYACKVQEADPNRYKGFHPIEEFDGHFTVLNTGANDWDTSKESYRFIGGTAFQKSGSSFAINAYTQVNHTYNDTIDMKAPGIPGRYVSIWSFEYREATICLITFSITVLDN